MDGKNKITEYRERLDKTLACHNLTDEGALRQLVRNHLLKSSQHDDEVTCAAEIKTFLENRTQVISNFLDMLRSASRKDPGTNKPCETSREWKVKQDNEDFRVMYREGPPGTLFHDLLVEGYIDGPIDVSLCASTEAPLYKCWWPQYSVPSFKILSSERLHQVRIGEQIASVKTKVSWPISSRECLLHFIEFEYFQEDLIIVVINSISGPDDVKKSTHGISKEMIPAEENGMVRMGVVGGFALQKVTNGRSYFRTMGSMDFKLDYVPSWVINFMARQLIGSGFKLYKKAVSSWANNDNVKFQQALEGPLYVRVREALLSDTKDNINIESKPSVSDTEEVIVLEGNFEGTNSESDDDGKTREYSPDTLLVVPKTPPVTDLKVTCEIEEEMSDESVISAEETHIGSSQPLSDQTEKKFQVINQKKVLLRPEVIEAVAILDKVITMVRELGINSKMNLLRGISNKNSLNAEYAAEEDMSSDDGLSLKDLVSTDSSKEVTVRQTCSKSRSSSFGKSRAARSSFSAKEVSHYAVGPASSPELNMQNAKETNRAIAKKGTTTAAQDMGKMSTNDQNNGIHDTITTEGKVRQRKNRFCCLHFPGGRGE
ncbi:unnamed protein product [Rhodiola kirilowii]